MRVSVDNGNATVQYEGREFRITIPSKKNIFIMLFLGAWLCGWAFGEIMVIGTLFWGAFIPFLLIWLIGWTVGGGFALYIMGWMLFGKEIISSDGTYLIIEKKVLGFSKIREYELRNIEDIRINDEVNSIFSRRNSMAFYGLSGGRIQFDYGMKTITFGINIDVAEARYLLDEVISRSISLD